MLRVRGLRIELEREDAPPLPVVEDASFDVPAGSITGVFGESGSGKSTLGLALPGLLGRRYGVGGSVRLDGRELIGLAERELENVRGRQIAMVFQDPLLALNPVLTVGRQIREALHAHGRLHAGAVRELLDLVGLGDGPRVEGARAHQLSGGERQRALIALALAGAPALVVADEPFSALDGPRVVELARLFLEWKQRLGTAFLIIDHSPRTLAKLADWALCLYAGQAVERGPARAVFEEPLHPYARALAECARAGEPIAGAAPALDQRPRGCRFEPRCPRRLPQCAAANPPECDAGGAHFVRCFLYGG